MKKKAFLTLTHTQTFISYDPLRRSYSPGNFENLMTDSDSPYPITFGQTLWKFGISSVGTTIDEENLIRNFENPTPDSDSPYPIAQGPTEFQSFMTNNSHLLIWCSFDPDANRQTNKQTIFFHMTLLTVEGI